MCGGDELNAREHFFQARYDDRLQSRMQMAINLIDENDRIAFVRIFILGSHFVQPLQQHADPAEHGNGSLTQGLDRHHAVRCSDADLARLGVDFFEANRLTLDHFAENVPQLTEQPGMAALG
jgi:hypothetical protein